MRCGGRLKLWKVRLLLVLLLESLWAAVLWTYFFLNRKAIRGRVMKLLVGNAKRRLVLVVLPLCILLFGGCASLSERYSFFSSEKLGFEKAITTVEDVLDPGVTTFWQPLELVDETFLDFPSDPDVVILRDVEEILAP